jgi:hypothetical protein
MAIGEIVQIFNRTTHPLKVMKDGRQHDIPVGRSWITEDLVGFARQQNPVMGTEDANSLLYQSLISIVCKDPSKQDHERHPLDTLDDELLGSLSVERLDRSTLAPDRQANVREVKMPFPKGRVGVEAPSENMVDPSGAISGSLGG